MFRNFFLINLVIIAVIAYLGVKVYRAWVKPVEIRVSAQKEDKPSDGKTGPSIQLPVRGSAYYQDIVSKDLFRPTRTPGAKGPDRKQTFTKDKPKLFGTTIMNGQKFAILEDPATKSTKIFYLNDSFSGFTVVDIEQDKVVLESNGEKLTIRLREDKGIKPVVKKPVRKPVKRPQPKRSRPAPRRSPPAARSQNPQ